jgi:hypothetical protein
MKSTVSKCRVPGRTALVLVVPAALAIATGAATQAFAWGPPPLPAHFSGLLNDYTPATPTVAGSPYEMHGKWSLSLNERGGAVFSAEMTMQTADFANTDPNHDPTKLNPHTHHITVSDGVVHNDPTDPINWKASCPTFKPAAAGGFVVTGTAYVTGNGGNPPFGNPSAATICVLGGAPNPGIATTQSIVQFSNFTLQFATGSLASGHFGTQAINGVVSRCDGPWDRDSSDCRVALVE